MMTTPMKAHRPAALAKKATRMTTPRTNVDSGPLAVATSVAVHRFRADPFGEFGVLADQ